MKEILLPPDKSILHRILILGSLSRSNIIIPLDEELIAEDIHSTISALRQLGVNIEIASDHILLHGVELHGLKAPQQLINCGNSGTTARLLMGLLAAQTFTSVLIGDESLSRRPMKRLADILNNELGADIQTTNSGLPVTINGKKLRPADISLPVASAQMKSALLLAGKYISGGVSVHEPTPLRDHTEIMLSIFAGELPQEFTYTVPKDISAASFLIAASILLRKQIILTGVGINPTRTRFLQILSECGLQYEVRNMKEEWGEIRADIVISNDSSVNISKHQFTSEDIPLIIDEIPILAVLAAFSDGDTAFRNAAELRAKESDRITLIVKNLRSAGVSVEEYDDGFTIYGSSAFSPKNIIVEHQGDHRIAMSFAVMALRSKESVTIPDENVVSISFPNFFTELRSLAL